MRKRKFISFTNDELNTMLDIFEKHKATELLNLVKGEIRIREQYKKEHEEWLKNQPTAYVC